MAGDAMTNPTNQAQRDLQHRQRLDWLRTHPALLATLPSAARAMDLAQEAALDTAIRGMKHVALYSANAKAEWGIRCLVSELRGEPVDTAQRYRRADGATA